MFQSRGVWLSAACLGGVLLPTVRGQVRPGLGHSLPAATALCPRPVTGTQPGPVDEGAGVMGVKGAHMRAQVSVPAAARRGVCGGVAGPLAP